MSGDVVDLHDQRSRFWQPIAQLLVTLLITSCAAGLGRSSPTPPAPPTFPVITPIMPAEEPSPTPQVSPTSAPTIQPTPGPGGATVHTVQPGDTLLGLARLYDIPMAAIQLENEIGGSTVVQVGQRLTIPPQEEWESASTFWIIHEVAPNETLIGIANAYDLDVDRLQTVNGLDDADRISAGQQLILPLDVPAPAPTPRPTDPPPPSATPPPTATAEQTPVASPQALATAGSSVAPAAASDPLAPRDLASWPQEIARLINEVRAQHGLPPFTYNQTLQQAAQAHADDCARRGWCSHTGSDGANIKSRVQRAGYDASGWAECWAQTQAPQKAVDIWMNETPPNDPHRRTLLSDWLSEIGLGVSDAGWGYYIIADFGRP